MLEGSFFWPAMVENYHRLLLVDPIQFHVFNVPSRVRSGNHTAKYPISERGPSPKKSPSLSGILHLPEPDCAVARQAAARERPSPIGINPLYGGFLIEFLTFTGPDGVHKLPQTPDFMNFNA
jgi:hypothetical protein